MAKQSQRKAYGEALVELGRQNKNVVALEADLGKSTMSILFQDAFPDRYFEMGIAEQNMLSTAAGLAASGKIAFAHTFAVFAAGRAFDQIRQTIAIGKLNVKICGSSSGLSDFGDGSTHQSIEDVAIMSVLPNMTVLTPCDAEEAKQAVFLAAEIDGPVYIRINRNDLEDYVTPDKPLELGKLRVLREGGDVLLAGYTSSVEIALDAADKLATDGVEATVVSVGSMKPFDEAGIQAIAAKVKAVVTVEDHNYIGGLASKVALALRRSTTPMDFVAMDDRFGQSAQSTDELFKFYGITSDAVAAKALALLKR